MAEPGPRCPNPASLARVAELRARRQRSAEPSRGNLCAYCPWRGRLYLAFLRQLVSGWPCGVCRRHCPLSDRFQVHENEVQASLVGRWLDWWPISSDDLLAAKREASGPRRPFQVVLGWDYHCHDPLHCLQREGRRSMGSGCRLPLATVWLTWYFIALGSSSGSGNSKGTSPDSTIRVIVKHLEQYLAQEEPTVGFAFHVIFSVPIGK